MINKKIISVGIALSLTACVATVNEQMKKPLTAPLAVVSPAIKTTENTHTSLTLEKVMSDPDWIGRAPESWYWGDDNETIFYQQKQLGTPLRDLYKLSLNRNNNVEQVHLSALHLVEDQFSEKNQNGTKEVYIFQGNVFLKDITSGNVQQLTYTSAIEHSPMFLLNGDVAYGVDNRFYRHSLSTHQIVELANLILQPDPAKKNNDTSYLAEQQQNLIDYVALQQRNKQLREDKTERLKGQNSSMTQIAFYFGSNKEIAHASLSPSGDKMVVSITSNLPTRKSSDIMPNYIQHNGNIKAKKVRSRVADNRQYSEELFLLDLKSGMKFPLDYKTLPGYNEDVLADVKAENFQRKGEHYKSKKQPRNIHIMQAEDPIKWQADGKQVAVMLEAWDNKDRWIASINLLENKLEPQHRLHDDAWINYTFNEFGWVGKLNKLYYLSEQSGYSHLYTKSLKGKAKQLTDGAYEISQLTLTNDNDTFYFKANKKHPGIYEVYSVDVTGENFTDHTALNGMVDYTLSPDESKLLLAYSSITMPPELYIKNIRSNVKAQQITNTVSDEFKQMPWAVPQIIAIPSSHQQAPIYTKIYLPKDHDKQTEQIPAVMFSHGAGYLQNSHLGWSGYFREFMFHSMLVQQGYAVIDMDYRASKGYGRDWRTAIYRQMGKPEVQDMLDGVNWLVQNANVDASRVGTYGGSYGGFLTLMALFNEPETFQSGAALRLVSDWAYYNHGYTSNILNTPEDDAIAYERSSPIYFAEGLNKPLLLNAPMVDDNVFFQDTVRLVQRLIELEKPHFETAIYPVEPHGFVQPSSWLDEYRRIFKLFEQTLHYTIE